MGMSIGLDAANARAERPSRARAACGWSRRHSPWPVCVPIDYCVQALPAMRVCKQPLVMMCMRRQTAVLAATCLRGMATRRSDLGMQPDVHAATHTSGRHL